MRASAKHCCILTQATCIAGCTRLVAVTFGFPCDITSSAPAETFLDCSNSLRRQPSQARDTRGRFAGGSASSIPSTGTRQDFRLSNALQPIFRLAKGTSSSYIAYVSHDHFSLQCAGHAGLAWKDSQSVPSRLVVSAQDTIILGRCHLSQISSVVWAIDAELTPRHVLNLGIRLDESAP